MTNINFDEPSKGQVNGDHKVALVVTNSANGGGVHGISSGEFSGVHGESVKGAGVSGKSETLWGVFGESQTSMGVFGRGNGEGAVGIRGASNHEKGGPGIWGSSKNHDGVFGESETGVGIRGKGPRAGFFEGNVEVTGDIRLLNADCAEDFDVSIKGDQTMEPGTVVVLNEDGNLEPSCQAYDKKVAGVISGAGGYKPGIVLDNQQQQQQYEDNAKTRMPVALLGKVYCKVDATLSPVEVGDLLTTSSMEGHAMKASDPINAFGTVIGKALKPLKEGKGLIPVLVALQ